MDPKRAPVAMPDLLVYSKAFTLGFFITEVFRLSVLLGSTAVPVMDTVPELAIEISKVLLIVVLVLLYFCKRGGMEVVKKIAKSKRLDLLAALLVGCWSNELVAPHLIKLHREVAAADAGWAPMFLFALLVLIGSPLIRHLASRKLVVQEGLRFIEDRDINDVSLDLLNTGADVEGFTNAILESRGSSGLVFGLDGPWGIGKSSFVNLVEKRLTERADNSVVVFRFEPLRYASEADLPARFIRDLSTSISKSEFAPEFAPAVSRYSRMLKGTADISFFGFKLAVSPSNETVDEALANIDEVLKRLAKRLVVVIDDLDRLDAHTVNNVLFAVRRTYNLSQATYLLCYDTELLVQQGDDARRTRHFLEKFITIKISLFVDGDSISSFLRNEWKSDLSKFVAIPPATLERLGSICSALADLVKGDLGARYQPFAGDLRKAKRFVNAALMMRMEQFDIQGTDFYASDLVNLILLHLHYPGLFRTIYAEETGDRSGRFSVRRSEDRQNRGWENSVKFQQVLDSCPDENAKFLISQLFDIGANRLNEQWTSRDARFYRGRACFNEPQVRTLERYLRLIVRFSTPDRMESIRVHQGLVDELGNGNSITEIFARPELSLSVKANAHEMFWRVLTSQAYSLNQIAADAAIDGLVETLPRYSLEAEGLNSSRSNAVFTLCQLLDTAGWGRASKRRDNSPENSRDITDRIFGEGIYENRSLIQQLSAASRGVLGWYDLMFFRMACSPDRGGQHHNVTTALVKREDINGRTEGLVSDIARLGMRGISQAIFKHFKEQYILTNKNIYDELDGVKDTELLGDSLVGHKQSLDATRHAIKSYLVYQLANTADGNGTGVGCGFYDETGIADKHGISKTMSRYLFDVCFNVSISPTNAYHFADHCIRNMESGFLSGQNDFSATERALVSGMRKDALVGYWAEHGASIESMRLTEEVREVRTHNYVLTYRTDLRKSFELLDGLVQQQARPTELPPPPIT